MSLTWTLRALLLPAGCRGARRDGCAGEVQVFFEIQLHIVRTRVTLQINATLLQESSRSQTLGERTYRLELSPVATQSSVLRIQDYTVKTCESLGEGGLGTVYTAEHGSGKLVAIKIGYAMENKDFTWCVTRPGWPCSMFFGGGAVLKIVWERAGSRHGYGSQSRFLMPSSERRQTALTEWNTYVALTHGQPCPWLPRVYQFGVYACPGGVAPWCGGPVVAADAAWKWASL